jgi:hypothetical protein
MTGPIYKMFRVGGKEAWYQLSKEEQDAMFARVDEARKSVGGKVIIYCDSAWNSEQWLFWGVEEFPSLEAVQEFTKCLLDVSWFRYVDSDILLGTAVPETA